MRVSERPPDTHYADTGEGFVGYQVFGEGPLEIVFFSSPIANIDVMWESPAAVRYFDRLASLGRVVCFNPRGTGVSDPIPAGGYVTFDYWADDALAVMDEVAVKTAAVVGSTDGGPMAIMFSATHPERVSALVLVDTYARFVRAEDYPAGIPEEVIPKLLHRYRAMWGTPQFYAAVLPSLAESDLEKMSWLGRYQRLSGSPERYTNTFERYLRVDVRAALPLIDVPTLIITHEDAGYHRAAHGHYLNEHISKSTLAALPGADTDPFFLADPETVLTEIESFLTGVRGQPPTQRTLATVMITDIVGSTVQAARLGDEAWIQVLNDHAKLTRQHLTRYRGKEVSDTGDGFIATFDGPTRAVTCATELVKALAAVGIELRAGLHTGEVEQRGDNIGGIAVHIAARVADSRQRSGVTVTRTVTDLVVGSGIEFEPFGRHSLKGVPDEWELFTVLDRTEA